MASEIAVPALAASAALGYATGQVDLLRKVVADVADARSVWRKLRLWMARDSAGNTRLQMLYWEVAFNISALAFGQRMKPAALLVSDVEWNRAGTAEALSAALTAGALAAVLAPYSQVPNYRWLFRLPWTVLAMDRLKGEDLRSMVNLADVFKGAEAALRPVAFGRKDCERLTMVIEDQELHATPLPQALGHRVHSVVISPPPLHQFLFTALWVGYLSLNLGRMWRLLRRAIDWRRRAA
jgi:hypothetical protein